MAPVWINTDPSKVSATSGDLQQMEERLHTRLTSSLTTSINENLK